MKIVKSSKFSFISFCVFLFLIFYFINIRYGFSQKKGIFLTSQQAIEDIEWLQKFIKDVHIAPNALFPEQEMNDSFIALKAKFMGMDKVSRTTLFINLLPVYYKVRDIHLSLFLPFPENDFIKQEKYVLDIKIKILNDNIYALGNTNPLIPAGSRILSVNNLPDSVILREIRAVSPSDGQNDFSKNRLAERNFVEFFPLLFPVRKENNLKIVQPERSDTTEVTISASQAEKNSFAKRSGTNAKNFHEVMILDSLKTALIRVSSFTEGSNEDFRDYLNFAFGEIEKRNITNVIIDLRNNEGGFAMRGEMLLSYLIPLNVPYVTNVVFKKSRMADEIFNRQSRNSPLLKRILVLDELMKLENSSYGTYDTVYYRETAPADKVFRGKVYVLINGLSVSTTGLVCNSLRAHRGALFIGEPGGFTSSGTYGQVIKFSLPHSRISGYMSTIRFNSTEEFFNDSLPFMPDVPVNETIEDVLQNRDPVFAEALRIIILKQQD